MPLTKTQVSDLKAAISGYAFPPVYFDFKTNTKINAGTMTAVEKYIRQLLISSNAKDIEHGLANVVYWGNANAGYQNHRVNEFRNKVTQPQLQKFQNIVAGGIVPHLKEISDLKMPQFSGISFISKIIAFLDPQRYCVLDLLISRLNNTNHGKALNSIKTTTQIGVTKNNSLAYYSWCKECISISNSYYGGAYRAVDIERGFFNLVQQGKLSDAQQIYIAI